MERDGDEEDSEAFISGLASFFTTLKLTELCRFFLNFNISHIKKMLAVKLKSFALESVL